MARSRKSGLESIIELAALLPPWASATLAVLSYFLLHYMSLQEVPTANGMEGAVSVLIASLKQQGARFGQYFVPAILLIGTIVSFFKRMKRTTLAAQTKANGKLGALLNMSWQEFELLVSEAYRQQGYQVTERGGAGPDGGVDLVLTKGSKTFLVQCKQWKTHKVGVDIVRQLYGVMAARGAAGGFVVTAGKFTADAKAFADGRNICLVDGQQLLDYLASRDTLPQAVHSSQSEPACPSCAAPMIKRKASKGPNRGQLFWGCSAFPDCKGTRPADSQPGL